MPKEENTLTVREVFALEDKVKSSRFGRSSLESPTHHPCRSNHAKVASRLRTGDL